MSARERRGVNLLLSELTDLNNSFFAEKINIQGLTSDSREVQPGYLFAAFLGSKADGRAHIESAVEKGAIVILALPGTIVPSSQVWLLEDENPRRRFSLIAARFYGAQPEMVAAVTGTNGKTSVVNFVDQIWSKAGYRGSCIGTLGLKAPNISLKLQHTTPDPVAMHRELAKLETDGVTHLVAEASSHGLDQYRLDGVTVKVAAFTNLSQDHLDYHGDLDSYFRAKLRLFSEILVPEGTAILHCGLEKYDLVKKVCQQRGHKVVSYGRKGADLAIISQHPIEQGQRLEIDIKGKRYIVNLPLVGFYQAENVMCALAIALETEVELAVSLGALEMFSCVSGRLQRVARHPCGADIYVDYAHTPDALESTLKTLRPYAPKQLVLVFGCGGDRDRGKRSVMGGVACKHADKVIITDDNPRNEDPGFIRKQVMSGCHSAIEVESREEAIQTAVSELGPGDILLIAGKGHEEGQVFKDLILPFNDAEVVRSAVFEVRGGC